MDVNFALWGVGFIHTWRIIRELGRSRSHRIARDRDGNPVPEITDPKYDTEDQSSPDSRASESKVDLGEGIVEPTVKS
jgi:hypothetical protein